MSRPILHFSHANGFPAPCYRAMLADLETDHRIGHIDRIGHDERFPVTEGWPHLVDELIAAIQSRYDEPVVGVGHSLGGYLSALAAAQRPDLFRAVVLLDAPIIPPFQGSAMAIIKRLGLIDRITPAGAMRYRRREWPSREDVEAHFKRRPMFHTFDPQCLHDYAQLGTVASEHGVALWFDADIEYRIYRTIPHNMAAGLKQLRVPGGFIGGRDSPLLRRTGLAYTRRLFRLALLAGGHLFPFEVPQVAAQAVRRMIHDLTATTMPQT